MDFVYYFVLLILIFFVSLLILIRFMDCDLVTFFYTHFGKQPVHYKGKVVWITGASSGIGEALAKELSMVGARIVLSARRKMELERVKQECLSLNSSYLKDEDILVLPLDVTSLESHEPALKNILKHFGKLDVLVSNAGQIQHGEFANMDAKVDKRIFDVNVFSVVNMSRMVVKYFLKNGGGQIAVVSSLGGKGPMPLSSVYSASKYAIQGYFHSLWMETYGKNISVTVICPGPIDTRIFSKCVTNKPELENIESIKDFFYKYDFMSAERCAYLSLVSMANRLNESWISRFPFVPIIYVQVYFPLLHILAFKLVGSRHVKQMMEKSSDKDK